MPLFLYPIGTDPFPELLAKAGFSPRGVNFERLGTLGGINALQRTPVAVVAVAPDTPGTAWLAGDVGAVLRPPLDRIALEASIIQERLARESSDLLETARALPPARSARFD